MPLNLPFSRFIPSELAPNEFEAISNRTLILVAVTIITLLISKSFLSLVVSYSTHRVAGSAAAQVGGILFRRLMQDSRTALSAQYETSQKIYALLQGCSSGVANSISAVNGLLSDGLLVVILVAVLIALNPVLGVLSFIYLLSIFILQNRLFASYMRRLMREESESHTKSNGWLQEVFRLYPELRVSGLPKDLSATWSRKARLQAVNHSMRGFVTSVPRQTFDLVVIIGAALLVSSQVLSPMFDLVLALTVVTFVIFRVLPALLRIQNYLLSLTWAITESRITRELWRLLRDSDQANGSVRSHLSINLTPDKPLQFRDVSFQYSGARPVIQDVSFELPVTGLSVLKGESGAGKSTIISLSLGFVPPTKGSVKVFGESPERFFDARNGWVAFVPQRPQGIAGTIQENVACYRDTFNSRDFLHDCLYKAGLEQLVAKLPNGVDTPLSEFGAGVSGGELQRLGLARALYGRPRLLILDEPFSALDAAAEESLSRTLEGLSRELSIMLATHRSDYLNEVAQVLDLNDGHLTVRVPVTAGLGK